MTNMAATRNAIVAEQDSIQLFLHFMCKLHSALSRFLISQFILGKYLQLLRCHYYHHYQAYLYRMSCIFDAMKILNGN